MKPHIKRVLLAAVLLICCVLAPLRAWASPLSRSVLQSYLAGSPLANETDNFIKWGQYFGVDPRLIVGIASAESSLGRSQCGTSNGWGWMWPPGHCANFYSGIDPDSKTYTDAPGYVVGQGVNFSTGWENGIFWVTKDIARSYFKRGQTTVDKIQSISPSYCASGCTNWVPNVKASMAATQGDPDQLGWPGSTSTPTGGTSQMASGWYWPTGTSDLGPYLGFLGYNSTKYPWHLAKDIKNGQGQPVFAIGAGEVLQSRTDVDGYGRGDTKGGALLIRFTSSDGTVFTALYGHVDSPHAVGHVNAGDVVGYSNSYDPPHLHFGINTNSNGAPSNPWRGYTSDKGTLYGFVDPFPFLSAHPYGGNVDTTPPVVTITSSQVPGQTYSTPQRVVWHIDDSGGSGLKTWGQNWDSDPGVGSFVNPDGYLDLPEGSHILHVHVKDNAGNEKDWTFGPYIYHRPTLLRAQGEGTVYLITSEGKRRAFTSKECFEDWGESFDDVQDVPRSVIDSYPWDEPIPHLIKTANSPDVFFIQTGSELLRRHVINMGYMGFRADDVRTVSQDRFNYFPPFKDVDVMEPRLYLLTTPTYDPSPAYIGRPAHFKVTVINFGGPGTTGAIEFRLIQPDGTFQYLPGVGSLSFDNYGTYAYDVQFTPNQLGHYSLQPPAFQSRGEWYLVVNSGREAESKGLDVLPLPVLSSITLNPSVLRGGQSTTGTVTLNTPAPVGGMEVTLHADSPSATVPATVTVPAGATSATFPVSSSVTLSPLSVIITGTLADITLRSTLGISPTTNLTQLTASPTTVAAGGTSTATVTLSDAAPAGGIRVALSSADTKIATVPSSLTVGAGLTSATFPVKTAVTTTSASVVVTAQLGGTSKTLKITVTPLAPVVTITQPSADKNTLSSATSVALAGQVLANGHTLTGVTVRLYRYFDAIGADGYWAGGTNWSTSAQQVAVTGTTSWSVKVPTLLDGHYALVATATDSAHKSFSSAPCYFWVEATPRNVSINDVTVNEPTKGAAPASFTVSLDKPSRFPITVGVKTANGLAPIATVGTDYSAITMTVTFAPGQTVQTVKVPVLADALDEDNETFRVVLSKVDKSNIILARATGTATIVDSNAPPTLSINSVTLNEGNSGTTNAQLTVKLSVPSGRTVTVNYATANGTATAGSGSGSDYVARTGSLTFAPGETSKTILVPVRGDTTVEANENFTVTLSDPFNAVLAPNATRGTVTITNDDKASADSATSSSTSAAISSPTS